jgi:ATP-binding cassette subfamily B protein
MRWFIKGHNSGGDDRKTEADWSLFRRNAQWAFRESWRVSRKHFLILMISSLVSAVVPAVMALIIGLLVNLIRKGVENQSVPIDEATWLLAGASLSVLVGHVSQVFGQYSRLRLSDLLRLSISKKAFGHANTLDLAFFEDSRSQDILSRATQSQGSDFLGFVLDSIASISSAVQITSLLGVLLWIDPLVTPVLVLLGIPWLMFRWHLAKIRYETLRSKTTKRRWSRYYLSRLIGRDVIPAVRLLGIGQLLLDKLEETMLDIMQVDRGVYRRQALGSLFAALVFTGGFLAVIAAVGYRTIGGVIPFHLLVSYVVAAFRFRSALIDFINRLAATMERLLTITNLVEFFDAQPSLSNTGAICIEQVRGDIELRDVAFAYPGTERLVLKNISLRIEPGDAVALVGPNGSGKTTLAKLICRLYDVSSGCIRLDGHDLRELRLDFLQQQIGFVNQGGVRFEATAHDNIAFGDWARLEEDRRAVQEIAKRTGADGILKDLPEGYDTQLGRMFGAVDLSGGQWQRLSITRALAKNAKIYILDEPTAHLDAQAEYQIFSAFRELTRDKTVLLISHRFSTTRMADRILVLDDGRIVEQGTHDDLIGKGGMYRELFNLHQFATGTVKDPG